MISQWRSRIWDKVYLWIFALLEGTNVDKLVRKQQSFLFPGMDQEKLVKRFYGEMLASYCKLIIVTILLGFVVDDVQFWVILSGGLVIAVVAPFYDIRQKLRKRTQELQRNYTVLLMKLLLYIGAGMSVRNAFEKMTEEMRQEREAGFLALEMELCVKGLKSGQMEGDCYYRFAGRCELPEYLRLSGLLAQNVKRGNSELLVLLENEMVEAKERQRHLIRRNGERASVRLLGPMMLLLSMVLLLIMIPAFGSL